MATKKYRKQGIKRRHFISRKNTNKRKEKSKYRYLKKHKNNKNTYKKRRGGMPNGKGKTVRFGEERVREFTTAPSYTDYEDEDSSISHYRRCPHKKYITPGIFPCRYKNTVFKNYDEYIEWVNLKRNAATAETSHGPDMLAHYRNIRDANLMTTGRWNKPIPPEYRIYNEETGEISDTRLFEPDSDEERTFLARQRINREKEKEKWMQDVAKFKREKVVLNSFMDDSDY
jgi:hypothetical protein